MDAATLLYAGAVLFLAYLVRGIAGFGSGLIAVPLLALRFPVTVVVPLVVFLDYVGSASQGVKNRSHIVWKDQLPLIPFSLIGVGIGLFLLSTMSTPGLGKALGGFVLVYAIYQLLPLPDLQGSRLFAIPCGLLGGFYRYVVRHGWSAVCDVLQPASDGKEWVSGHVCDELSH